MFTDRVDKHVTNRERVKKRGKTKAKGGNGSDLIRNNCAGEKKPRERKSLCKGSKSMLSTDRYRY